MRVWRCDVAAGTWKLMTGEEDALESFSLSPDGKTLALVYDGPTASRLELRDATSLALRWAPKIPIGQAARRPAVAWLGGRVHALSVYTYRRRVLGGRPHRRREPVDHQRDRQLQPGGAPGPGNRHVEELRWPGDLRRALPSARAVHRPSARDYQHPRGARRSDGARAPALPGPQQLFPQRARRRDSVSERPRQLWLRQGVRADGRRGQARGCGEGHRRACSTGSRSSRRSTRPG